MTQRTCSSCGAHVALLEDRCRHCGADPDVRLVELGGVESRRSPGRQPPRRTGSWRRWAPAAAGVALVWALLVVTGGSGEDDQAREADGTTTTRADEATTTSRAGPTTTTTEVLPGAPLLRETSGLRLVAVVAGVGRVVDLDTGTVILLRGQVLGASRRGLLVRDRGNLVTWPAPYDGSAATTIATPPDDGTTTFLDPTSQTWVVGDGTLVWLVQSTPTPDGPPSPLTGTLLDLDGRVLAQVDIPVDAWPVGGLDGGIVVAGPGGMYAIDLTGGIQRISTGNAVGVSGDRIFAYNCDERYRCGLEVFDEEGRLLERRPVGSPQQASAFPGPDGRIAAIVYDNVGQTTHVTVDGEVVYQPALVTGGVPPGGSGNLSWSPDGRWLAIPDIDGVHLVDTLGGTEPVVVDVGPGGQSGYVLLFAPSP